MWDIISAIFVASIFADIWLLILAIIGFVLSCAACANEQYD